MNIDKPNASDLSRAQWKMMSRLAAKEYIARDDSSEYLCYCTMSRGGWGGFANRQAFDALLGKRLLACFDRPSEDVSHWGLSDRGDTVWRNRPDKIKEMWPDG